MEEILRKAIFFNRGQILGQVGVSIREAVSEVHLIVVISEFMRESEGVILLGISLEAHLAVELVLGVNNLGACSVPAHAIFLLLLCAVA